MTAESQPLADEEPMARSVPGHISLWSRLGRWPQRLAMIGAIIVAVPILATLLYTVVPPPISNLMIIRLLAGNGIDKHWVPLSPMSADLPRAVIASEDARFCEH